MRTADGGVPEQPQRASPLPPGDPRPGDPDSSAARMNDIPADRSDAGVLEAGTRTGLLAGKPAGITEDAVCASYKCGLAVQECADEYQLTVKKVRGILQRNRVPRRHPGRRPKTPYREQDLITALCERPVTGEEIADQFGIGLTTVRRVQNRIPPAGRTFLRPTEAARLLRLNVRQVAALAVRGQLSEHRTSGGKRRYIRAEIQALARNRTKQRPARAAHYPSPPGNLQGSGIS